MNDDQTGSNPADRGGKVGRVIREYGLDGLGTELEARWTGKGGDQYSLRALADRFNQRVLEAALEDAGVRSLEGDVENHSPGEDARRSLEIIVGFYLSHYTEAQVSVPLERPLRDVTITSW
jgi:hypothetical protein